MGGRSNPLSFHRRMIAGTWLLGIGALAAGGLNLLSFWLPVPPPLVLVALFPLAGSYLVLHQINTVLNRRQMSFNPLASHLGQATLAALFGSLAYAYFCISDGFHLLQRSDLGQVYLGRSVAADTLALAAVCLLMLIAAEHKRASAA